MTRPPSLGDRIRAARTAAGASQQVLALACGVAEQTIHRIEHDKHSPGTALLRRLCLALDVSADQLLGLPQPKGSQP